MKFAGFALLAAGLAFVFHAYSPGKFDASRPASSLDSEHAFLANDRPLRLTRNFTFDRGPVPGPAEVAARESADVPATEVPTTIGQATAASPGPTGQAHLPAATVAPLPVQMTSDDANSRSSIVRRIKRELRRVGCYDGRIDSEWDRPARAAMGTFIERVNATLPSRDPDVVLLNLVRNHPAVACGNGCPTGQSMDRDGQCLPNAIIAKTKRSAGVAIAENKNAAKPFEKTVTFTEMKPTAATLPPPQAPVHAAVRAPRPAPLPGRMAVGAAGNTTASVAPPEKSWWDNFIGTATETRVPPRDQTLDRPAGLTHVPQPRLVRQALAAAPDGLQRASLEETPISGGTGDRAGAITGDSTALLAAGSGIQTVVKPPQATGRSYRKARAKPARQKYARRVNARNVQAMFQHPLGRM